MMRTLKSDRERPPMTSIRKQIDAASLLVAVLCVMSLTGCGYMVGSVYQSDVRSVHVPIFTSDSYRRGVEFQLTDAVQKEIQKQTHFRLAKEGNADSRLTGRIVRIKKRVLGESAFDDPRELELAIAVEVTWEDLRNGEIIAQQRVPIESEEIQLLSTGSFAPEVGQSLATAEKQVIDRIARQVVEMMEMPW
jgi:hypothetical protein